MQAGPAEILLLLSVLAVHCSCLQNASMVLADSVEGEYSDNDTDDNFVPLSMRPELVTLVNDAPFEQEVVTIPDVPVMPLSGDQVEIMNNDDSTWTARTYQEFEDIDVRDKCGALLVSEQMRKLPKAVHSDQIARLTTLPESFDARSKWPRCRTIQHIRNQGHCQSSWAISAASVMSDRYCIHMNLKIVRIASTDLINCCGSSCAPNKGNGCKGGYPNRAFEYWIRKGLTTERCNTYVPKMDDCDKTCDMANLSWAHDHHQGKSSYRVGPEVVQIQAEIMNFGPVTAGFTVYQDFVNYKSGVYQHKTGEKVGAHAVRIIGWGVDRTREGLDIPYWLIANSWNTSWGESGYVRFLKGSNHLGIEGWIHTGVPSQFLNINN